MFYSQILEFLISCFAKFSSNFAKFREKQNKNLGEIFTISRNTKPKLGAHFCYCTLGGLIVYIEHTRM